MADNKQKIQSQPLEENYSPAEEKKRLKEETGNTIEFMGVIKPELIGGFVLRIGNTRIDASYARQLREIRNQLIEKN